MNGIDIRQALKRFSYGDENWKFYLDDWCNYVRIEWKQPDSRRPNKVFVLRTHIEVNESWTADRMFQALACEILALRDHEVREGIRVDGEILMDPHRKSWADGPDGYVTRRLEIHGAEEARAIRREKFMPDGTAH